MCRHHVANRNPTIGTHLGDQVFNYWRSVLAISELRSINQDAGLYAQCACTAGYRRHRGEKRQDAAELSILQGTEYLLNHAVDSVRCMSEGRAMTKSFQMVIGPVLRQRSHALSVGRRRLYIFTKSKYVNGHR